MLPSKNGALFRTIRQSTDMLIVRFTAGELEKGYSQKMEAPPSATPTPIHVANLRKLNPTELDFFFQCFDFVRLGVKAVPSEKALTAVSTYSKSTFWGGVNANIDSSPMTTSSSRLEVEEAKKSETLPTSGALLDVMFLPGGRPCIGWFHHSLWDSHAAQQAWLDAWQRMHRCSPASVRVVSQSQYDTAQFSYGGALHPQLLRPAGDVSMREMVGANAGHLRAIRNLSLSSLGRKLNNTDVLLLQLMRLSLSAIDSYSGSITAPSDSASLCGTASGALTVMRSILVEHARRPEEGDDEDPRVAKMGELAALSPPTVRPLWGGVSSLVGGCSLPSSMPPFSDGHHAPCTDMEADLYAMVERLVLFHNSPDAQEELETSILVYMDDVLNALTIAESTLLSSTFFSYNVDSTFPSTPGEGGLLDNTFLMQARGMMATKQKKLVADGPGARDDDGRKLIADTPPPVSPPTLWADLSVGPGLNASQYLTRLLAASDMLCAALGLPDDTTQPEGTDAHPSARGSTLTSKALLFQQSLRVAVCRRYMVNVPQAIWETPDTSMRAFPFLEAFTLSIRKKPSRLFVFKMDMRRGDNGNREADGGDGSPHVGCALHGLSVLFPALTPCVLDAAVLQSAPPSGKHYTIRGGVGYFGGVAVQPMHMTKQDYQKAMSTLSESGSGAVGVACDRHGRCMDVFSLASIPLHKVIQ